MRPDEIRYLEPAGELVSGADYRNDESEHDTYNNRQNGDEQSVSETLHQVYPAILVKEGALELFNEILGGSVSALVNDNLARLGVAVGEVDVLQAVFGNSHAGYAYVSLAGINRRNNGIERHIVNDKLLADDIAYGSHHVNVEADYLALFLQLVGRELSVGSHYQPAAVSDALRAFVGVLAVLGVNQPVLLDEVERAVLAEL